MTTPYEIKCAKCHIPIEGSEPEPQPHDILTCPSCGESDTLENVQREVGEYVASKASDALGDFLASAVRGNKYMTYEKGPREHRSYRFIVDYRPEF
jgi:hypothetical protein